jgi:hypothetical protein
VVFRAVVAAIIPESDTLDEGTWVEVEIIVERALATRPPAVCRQLALFVVLLRMAARLRHGRGLARLSVVERFTLLETLSKSRLLLLRRGVWGIRTLALMGYYARPAAAGSIGYRASSDGWSARVAPVSMVPR